MSSTPQEEWDESNSQNSWGSTSRFDEWWEEERGTGKLEVENKLETGTEDITFIDTELY